MVLFAAGPVRTVGEVQILSVRHQIGKPLFFDLSAPAHPPQKMAVFIDHILDDRVTVAAVLHGPQLAGNS